MVGVSTNNFKVTEIVTISLVALLNLAAITNSIVLKVVLLAVCLSQISHIERLVPVYMISSLSSDYYIFADGLGTARLIGMVIIIGVFSNRRAFFLGHSRLTSYLFLVFPLIILSAVSSVTGSLRPILSYLQLFTIIAAFECIKVKDIVVLSRGLLWSASLSLIIIIISSLLDILEGGFLRFKIADNVNENRLAIMLTQLGCVLIASIVQFSLKWREKGAIIAVLSLTFLLIFVTGSRSSLIAFVGVTIYAALASFNLRSLVFFTAILGIGFVVLPVVIDVLSLDDRLLARYTLESFRESGGSQVRFEVWRTLLPDVISSNPLFGLGIGAENVLARGAHFNLDKPAHNLLIDLFLQVGLLGSLLFVTFLGRLFLVIMRFSYLSRIPQYMLLGLVLNGIGETIWPERFFWSVIALFLLFYSNREKNIPGVKVPFAD